MISTSNLWVTYGDFVAIRGMNLEIEGGLVYGLIGPNGAGKTSLIRVLATLLEPAYGDVRIGGIDPLLDPEGARRLLGFMPDTPPLYEDLLVREFLTAFAAGYEIPRRERAKRIDECLALTDLTGKVDTLVAGLSRGM
ncbi:MAG: ABC transporter ATP-binding protein, partial [Planctomycetes bacterium]|nr:ABC transporter ATP-binding protein [Planctomycetota bacterium]